MQLFIGIANSLKKDKTGLFPSYYTTVQCEAIYLSRNQMYSILTQSDTFNNEKRTFFFKFRVTVSILFLCFFMSNGSFRSSLKQLTLVQFIGCQTFYLEKKCEIRFLGHSNSFQLYTPVLLSVCLESTITPEVLID